MRLQKKWTLLFLSLFCLQALVAQEACVLGIGITPNETIISVFQLNEEQADKMANLGAELQYRNEILSNELENTRKKHPQSSEEDLIKLAGEYKIMIDSMGRLQRMIDKKVLLLFNKKQYNRYVNLCQEAFRRPIYVVPVNYNDSIVAPK